MPGHRPEQEGEGGNTRADEDGDPYGATNQELLDVRLTDPECSERSGFRLPEEYQDGVQLVLMGDEEKNGDGEGYEELRADKSVSIRLQVWRA